MGRTLTRKKTKRHRNDSEPKSHQTIQALDQFHVVLVLSRYDNAGGQGVVDAKIESPNNNNRVGRRSVRRCEITINGKLVLWCQVAWDSNRGTPK